MTYIASYGIHSNAGAVHIFDSKYFTYLGKMHADRALARFGRSFTQNEDYVFIGAPRYHEVWIIFLYLLDCVFTEIILI